MKAIRIATVTVALTLSLTAAAQERTKSGDWHVYKLALLQVANTSNEAGATVGVVCSIEDKGCAAYLLAGTGCEVGSKVPMMINSPVGAFPITTTCSKFPGSEKSPPDTMNVISEYGAAKAAFESGGTVGFVMPLQGGQFKVLRFSTIGATAAIADAMTLPAVGPQDTPSNGPNEKKAAEIL